MKYLRRDRKGGGGGEWSGMKEGEWMNERE